MQSHECSAHLDLLQVVYDGSPLVRAEAALGVARLAAIPAHNVLFQVITLVLSSLLLGLYCIVRHHCIPHPAPMGISRLSIIQLRLILPPHSASKAPQVSGAYTRVPLQTMPQQAWEYAKNGRIAIPTALAMSSIASFRHQS